MKKPTPFILNEKIIVNNKHYKYNQATRSYLEDDLEQVYVQPQQPQQPQQAYVQPQQFYVQPQQPQQPQQAYFQPQQAYVQPKQAYVRYKQMPYVQPQQPQQVYVQPQQPQQPQPLLEKLRNLLPKNQQEAVFNDKKDDRFAFQGVRLVESIYLKKVYVQPQPQSLQYAQCQRQVINDGKPLSESIHIPKKEAKRIMQDLDKKFPKPDNLNLQKQPIHHNNNKYNQNLFLKNQREVVFNYEKDNRFALEPTKVSEVPLTECNISPLNRLLEKLVNPFNYCLGRY